MSHKLDNLLRLAEQSYIRMEAELLITTCVHDGDLAPFNDLLEELVMAGPTSLFVLRDIHQNIRKLKSQLSQEGLSIRQDFRHALMDFGVRLPKILLTSDPESWWRDQKYDWEAQIVNEKLGPDQAVLAKEVCVEAWNKVSQLSNRLVMVNELECAVQDWISGLIYEHAHDYDALYVSERGLPEH